MKDKSNFFFFNVFIASSYKVFPVIKSPQAFAADSYNTCGFNRFEGVSIVKLCLSYYLEHNYC